MVTAVDTNILLDIIAGTKEEAERARKALVAATGKGLLILSPVCYAELAGNFPSAAACTTFLEAFDLTWTDLDEATAFLAGQYYKQYRDRGGTRNRILSDFLIAAHAQINADRILTCDKRFFGTQFLGLIAITYGDL